MDTGTIAKTFARCLTRNLLVALALAALLTVSLATEDFEPITRESSPRSPAALIEANDCWTGGEGHPLPSRVVVSHKGRTFVGGRRLTERAFEQIFDGTDHGLTVHAFCK